MNDRYCTELLDTFKLLLKTEEFGSQVELSSALSSLGFEGISQTKVSRLLKKVGAVKMRNYNNTAVYRLVEQQHIPMFQQSIDSMILNIKHNGVQIIIKTVTGGASLISKIIENMGEQSGILGCMASDNIVLVLPTQVEKIQKTTDMLFKYLDLKHL